MYHVTIISSITELPTFIFCNTYVELQRTINLLSDDYQLLKVEFLGDVDVRTVEEITDANPDMVTGAL